MATYKVIQDIEAEDKLVGPFSLRQFIYLAIVLILGFLAYTFAKLSIIIAIPFVFPILFFGALAAPISQDQSTEVWLLAKIRFLLKPRRRIWSQDGIKDLVTITVPKRAEQVLTDGLSQTEVRSRLGALASTLDSRGWAVKNSGYTSSDRLVPAQTIPQPVSDATDADAIDMMDAESNATAQNLDRMIQQTAQNRRQDLVNKMQHPEAEQQVKQPDDYWFMQQQQVNNKAGFDSFGDDKVVHPGVVDSTQNTEVSSSEQAILNKVMEEKAKPSTYNNHMKTIQPLSTKRNIPTQTEVETLTPVSQKPQAQPKANPGIMRLASNDDLNISTIAREASRGLSDGDEVEVSLH